jgi:hypothetical protein
MSQQPKLCICQVNDRLVRETAKRLKIPLAYAREIKRMHRRLKIHEWPVEAKG